MDDRFKRELLLALSTPIQRAHLNILRREEKEKRRKEEEKRRKEEESIKARYVRYIEPHPNNYEVELLKQLQLALRKKSDET